MVVYAFGNRPLQTIWPAPGGFLVLHGSLRFVLRTTHANNQNWCTEKKTRNQPNPKHKHKPKASALGSIHHVKTVWLLRYAAGVCCGTAPPTGPCPQQPQHNGLPLVLVPLLHPPAPPLCTSTPRVRGQNGQGVPCLDKAVDMGGPWPSGRGLRHGPHHKDGATESHPHEWGRSLPQNVGINRNESLIRPVSHETRRLAGGRPPTGTAQPCPHAHPHPPPRVTYGPDCRSRGHDGDPVPPSP